LNPLGKQKAKPYYTAVDEGRKRVLLIAASILAARKLSQLESTRPSLAQVSAINDAIVFAERIMKKIDELFPSRS
jgi:hypothetical protein